MCNTLFNYFILTSRISFVIKHFCKNKVCIIYIGYLLKICRSNYINTPYLHKVINMQRSRIFYVPIIYGTTIL